MMQSWRQRFAKRRSPGDSSESESDFELDPGEATSLLSEKPIEGGQFDEGGYVEQKLQYPKAVFFIVVNEFCERFSFYGLRTLLALYLNKILLYSVDSSTVIYHAFVSLCYFTPVIGAIIADSILGKFRTIVYLSMVFAIGNITLTIASADTAIAGMPAREISMLGLFLIALGTGGIKPCVASFGGDQFVLPQQQVQLERFFSVFYFTINAGSFVSTFLTPILREDVSCLGKDSCYPVAFGIPAILMIIAIVAFLLGKKWYIMKKPGGNIIMEIFQVIGYAICTKRKSSEKKEHWLDYATEKYGKKSVSDIKAMLRVVFLYLPLPIFWALYDQQGSRWTFQATRMNGAVGSWIIKAEQLQVINPILILAFVPLFDVAIYPLLSRCNLLTKPLQRLGFGGILAGVSFLISAFVELSLEPTYAVVAGPGEGQLRFYNGFDCPLSASLGEDHSHIINALDIWEVKDIPVHGETELNFKVILNANCTAKFPNYARKVKLTEMQARSYLITGFTQIEVNDALSLDDVEKTSNANPKIRVIYNFKQPQSNRILEFIAENEKITELPLNATLVGTNYVELDISTYTVKFEDLTVVSGLKLEVGGVYSLLVNENQAGELKTKLQTITAPNSVHMLWLLPQFIVMTMGEVMYSVTGVQFSFTQAPVSMKAVLQAAWLLTVAFGNVIVVIIAESRIFKSQMYEFLLFAALMFLDMILFAAMAWNYKYVDIKEEEEDVDQVAMKPRKSTLKSGVENNAFSGDQG